MELNEIETDILNEKDKKYIDRVREIMEVLDNKECRNKENRYYSDLLVDIVVEMQKDFYILGKGVERLGLFQ